MKTVLGRLFINKNIQLINIKCAAVVFQKITPVPDLLLQM